MKKKGLWKYFSKALLIMALLFFGSSGVQVKAAQGCYFIETSNKEEQNYTIWADTINSYLSYDGKQIMRVEAPESNNDDQRILVEYYDLNYKFISQKAIAEELPIFGGFYETDENYYIVSGQKNPNKDDNLEVFRITKYDKKWNRIKSTGLNGANTKIPFDAGSVRMADNGEYLVIRTAHEMYNGHQANVTIQVKMDTMQITDSFTGVMNMDWGYVSHSFNQFIEIDNGRIVALDHGDCYPRSLVLAKYVLEVSSGKFQNAWNTCEYTNVISFQSSGSSNMNYTGASVGAFEVTDSKYLAAGNYVGTEKEVSDSTRNIFVASISKDLSETKVNWITNHTDGTVSTPHMVSIGNSEHMLLWSREDKVYYTKIDKNGNKVGNIYNLSGALSDCIPTLVSGKLVWYVTSGDTITFYQINCSNLSDIKTVTQTNGHTYEYTKSDNGYANFSCLKCGEIIQKKIADKIRIGWSDNWTIAYESLDINEQLQYFYVAYAENYSTEGVIQDYTIEVSNPDVVEVYEEGTNGVAQIGYFKAKKEGITNVTFIPKYNEELAKTYTICVGNTQCVTEVNFDPMYVSIEEKHTKQLNAIAGPTNATDKTLIYTSLDPSIATVSNSGVVTAKKVGKTTIIATAKYGNGNYIDGVCYVEVTKAMPNSVTGLKIGGRATDALRLNWNKNSNASGYIIEQYKNGKWTRIARIGSNSTTTYRVEKLSASTSYKFRVQSFVLNGNAATYSDWKSIDGKTLPTTVGGLKIGGRATDALRLNWNKNSNASGYIIEQYKDGKWTRIAKIQNNSTTTYRIEKLSGSTTYKFRVQSYSFDGSTPLYSSWQTISGKTLPTTVGGLKIGGRATDALRLNWNKNSNASGYIIEQYRDGKWTRIAKIQNNSTTTYRVEGLSASASYKFRVQSYSFDGSTPLYSSWQSISGKTLPTMVSGLRIGGRATDALRLNWDKNSNASGYIIEQYKDGKWTRIAKIQNNSTTTYRVEKLSKSTTYKFRVQTYNFDGNTAIYSSWQYVNGLTK